MKYQNQEVRILDTDSNANANWWVCLISNPDQDFFVNPSELTN